MEHKKIGQVTDEIKEIFNIVLEASDIKVNKEGLRSHMMNHIIMMPFQHMTS